MSKSASISRLALALAFGAASFALIAGEPAKAQTAQQPVASTPGAAPTTTMPSSPSMPMQQMEHGQGMGGMGISGQGHQGMMGGQGQHMMPMGSMPQCPPGQTASGNPPTCQ